MILAAAPAVDALTPEQRRIVDFGDGPAVVIAGAGTGKTRVIVERVRHLLATRDDLVPEQFLVLTYNVKAARELHERLDTAIGVGDRSRMTVTNFHSFCQQILTDSSADAGLPSRPDVLDGVGQVLLLKDIGPELGLVYHNLRWGLGGLVQFINRAKDELVGPATFDAFVATERRVYEERYGSYDNAVERLLLNGNLEPLRKVRGKYATLREHERAEERGEARTYNQAMAKKEADKEARRTIGVTGRAHGRSHFDADDHPRIDALAATYVADGAALEILRLTEMARVYHAYEDELGRRGALDYGEQIAGVATLFKTRTNVLRRWQRQYRYILVDEFQDANVAQIELIELLGRTPDRPDNVMVVGDDDQSIYRFRGASFAAFAEFDRRFSEPPIHDPAVRPPGPPVHLRLEQNFRSVRHILTAANRLIVTNETRFEPDKRLVTEREDGEAVRVIVCAGPDDEAVAIVDAIKAEAGPATGRRWQDVAILYRKHKHRDAIVARLRDEDIPYTVVGGLSLFDTPEIRDLEQGLRAIANPLDGAALVRMMTAGPWRLDALEIVAITRMANAARLPLIETISRIVGTGELEVDVVSDGEPTGRRATTDIAPPTQAKLRILLGAINELNPLTFRQGPFTIVGRYLERTGQILDLIATGTLEAKRTVTNLASFLRFASDWQAANPRGTLATFVAYLDAYQAADGELPTSVELAEDVAGVRLMTLYQAKGLEFPIVVVPNLLEKEWPTKQMGFGPFPKELLREAIPVSDVHTDEERRLLYVAMTRAQELLILTTHGGPTATKGPSQFVGEIVDGAGPELVRIDRTGEAGPDSSEALTDRQDPLPAGMAQAAAEVRRVMPLPTSRERRLALRLRASELVGLMEASDPSNPETDAARDGFSTELERVARSAGMDADRARANGLHPLTFRSIGLDSGSGANLLQVAPLPGRFSFSAFRTYDACGLQYAFGSVYRIPGPDRPVAAYTFGTTAHAAFEAFTKDRRERLARGEAPPGREDLEREFRSRWVPSEFGDQATEDGYRRKVATLLDNFWQGEIASLGEALNEELWFDLTLDPGDGSPPVIVGGSIDRIDRLPSGGIEVVDYKTGSVATQTEVDKSLQLSIYALACRDALGLGTPERLTLYFTEAALRFSTTRSDEELDAVRGDILARVALMRAGEFPARPGKPCRYCDYRAMCPERV